MREWRLVWVFVSLVAACSGGGKGSGVDGTAPTTDAGPITMPPPTCDVPAAGMLVDTSHPTTVVGTGTAPSCTEDALRAAIATGGIITFDCGTDAVIIALTQALTINNVAGSDQLGDTVVDGGGTVTLSGGGKNRVFYLNACAPPYNSPHCDTFPHPALTVQRLTLSDGYDDSTDGGGAIYRQGGSLTVINSVFLNNTCAATGQDTAGGAIRLVQATPALIVGSTIGQPDQGNKCSNGGAIGSLQASPVTVINTVIDSNTATGIGGNPGNGGNGGAIYHDGTGLDLSLCGVTVSHATGAAYGGGIFYVDDAGMGTVSIIDSAITDDAIPVVTGQPSHGGAAYLQGANVTIANTTVANTMAGFAAGIYVNPMNGRGTIDATNLTVTGVGGDAFVLEDGVTGTLLNTTVAGNTRGIAGGGATGMTLKNSIVAGQTGANCTAAPIDGGGNVQFPGTTCAGASGDPLLGALLDNGGTTGVPTMAPGAGSPALGAGHGCPSTDARGMARPSDGCTSGAYQAE